MDTVADIMATPILKSMPLVAARLSLIVMPLGGVVRRFKNVWRARIQFTFDALDNPIPKLNCVGSFKRRDPQSFAVSNHTFIVAAVQAPVFTWILVPSSAQPFRPFAVVPSAFLRHLERFNLHWFLSELRHNANSNAA